MSKFTYLIVHHTASLNWTFNDTKNYHMKTLGYQDIGYNFFIEKDGTVITGRSLLIRGGHTYGYNHSGIGICLAGNFEKEMPTKQQLTSLTKTLDNLRNKFTIPKKNVLMHRDVYNTACPGVNLVKFIEDYKKLSVAGQFVPMSKANSVELEYGPSDEESNQLEKYMLKLKVLLNLVKSLITKSDGTKTITGVAITLLSGLLGNHAGAVVGLVTTAVGLACKTYKAIMAVIKEVKVALSDKE